MLEDNTSTGNDLLGIFHTNWETLASFAKTIADANHNYHWDVCYICLLNFVHK